MQYFTGIEYLKIDIANNYGMDKKTWNQRLEWFEAHKDNLDNLVKEADNPALFYAGIQAYKKALNGEATGYPISLDATTSGCQLIGILRGDKKACMLTNAVPNTEGKRMDLYTYIYDKVKEKAGVGGNISRDVVKKAIMTAGYGSTAKPKEVFGELYPIFVRVMQEELPGVWNYNEACLSLWNSQVDEYSWVMPDNFRCVIPVEVTVPHTFHWCNEPRTTYIKEKKAKESGRSYGANFIHSVDSLMVREITRRCMYNPQKIRRIKKLLQIAAVFPSGSNGEATMVSTLWNHYERSGFLSARIIDYINEDTLWEVKDPQKVLELINSFPVKPFEVITIHDSYRVLPNYGNDIRKQYRNVLAELHKSKLLVDIMSQATGRNLYEVEKYEEFSDEVMNLEYAIC